MLDALEWASELAGATAHDGFHPGRRRLLGQRCLQRARAVGRELERNRVGGPLVEHRAEDLRDHIAGALQDHGIADPDVLTGDLVGVVQGCVLDHHAAHRHWAQPRHRRHRARAAHLNVDSL